MTVEERCSKVTSAEDHGELMKTVFEVTGISSREVIESAVKACKDEHGRHKIDDVIAYLVQNNTNHGPMQVSRDMQLVLAEDSKSKNVASTLVHPHNSGAIIDLTAENTEDDLQQAIAASLKDQPPGVTREDQEISRVIEVSLLDNKPGSKRKRTDACSDDSSDPTSERRVANNPVGIKNVGLTCWFSSVVQTLFHLPVFRNLVLHYGSVTRPQDTPALKFMQELRELFALMLCTRRRFVDPTKAVEILKQSGGFGTGGGTRTGANAQEDVNEFKHKLFDLLEEAFKADHKQSPPSSVAQGLSTPQATKGEENPMIRLFRGRTKVERITASGTVSTKEEEFGQWILSVDRVNNIHESIEASIVGYVEGTSCGSELPQNSAQEQWFVKLPPFLTFELLRANFNQQLHRAEKLHNKFTFPDGIYLDRYLESNKEVIRRKRDESKALKEQLADLQSRLDRYVNFGSGSKRFPLREVLQCTLEFASSSSGTGQADRSPSPMLVTCNKGPSSGSPADDRMDIPSPPAASSPAPMDIATPSSSPVKLSQVQPAPRHVTRNELRVLQECLTRWRTEVEADIKEIHNNITTIETQIANIYEGHELKKHYYQLHSVVVHDGQASSGHYWAYVRSFSHENRWLKFNDMAVTEADWEELERDGAGGYLNTSAYCLIYVEADTLHAMQHELPTVESAYQSLPDDLKLVVDDDWQSLASEAIPVSETASETVLTNARTSSSAAETSVNPISARQHHLPMAETVSDPPDPCNRHAALLASWVQLSLNGCTKDPTTGQLNLNELTHDVYITLKRLARQLPNSLTLHDSRLVHIVIYLMECTKLSEDDIKINFIIDQIRRLGSHSDKRMNEVVELAHQHIASHKELYSEKQSLDLHMQYDLFRRTTALFVEGAKLFHDDRHELAVKWLLEAYRSNEQLLRLYDCREQDRPKQQYSAMDAAVLSYYRRVCLLHVNDMAAHQFESDYRKAEQVANTVRSIISPGLRDLADSGIAADGIAAEEIRKKWCDFLNNEESLSESQAEGLKKMLEVLLDTPSELHSSTGSISAQGINPQLIGASLKAEYDKVIADAHQRHYLDMAAREFKSAHLDA